MNIQESIKSIMECVQDTLTVIEWAEEEIARSRSRHPDVSDTLYHSFKILSPSETLITTEFVYRAHAVELLERVAYGADTRPATAAEVCCVLCEASQVTPLSSSGSGLYCRMWKQAVPDMPVFWDDAGIHHEALEGSRIDELERYTRAKVAVPDRVLGEITCMGRHHGANVTCRYAQKATGVDRSD